MILCLAPGETDGWQAAGWGGVRFKSVGTFWKGSLCAGLAPGVRGP